MPSINSPAPAISLGRTEITAAFSTTSTAVVQVTGLTRTVTFTSSTRDVEIAVMLPDVQGSGVINVLISIWDGTVGTGTKLQEITWTSGGSGYHQPMKIEKVISPITAGSKTYNVGMYVGSGTGTIGASTTNPAYIAIKLM